ncbi:hypothetical protein D9M71_556820 [compost metagenome]
MEVRTYSWLSYMLRMRILMPGWRLHSLRVSSRPFMSFRPTSTSSRSSSVEATSSRASAPDSAWATTSKCGIAESRAFTPSRTSTWSSIRAILMGWGKLITASGFSRSSALHGYLDL